MMCTLTRTRRFMLGEFAAAPVLSINSAGAARTKLIPPRPSKSQNG
jgi:hypothetical protein